MMKKITLLSLALSAMTLFGCKDQIKTETPENAAPQTVTVNFAAVASKSVDNSVATSTKTSVKDGILLFYTEAGVRVHSYTLPTNPEGSHTIANVPTSATKVLMIANYVASGNGVNYADFDAISLTDAKAKSIAISSLQSEGNGVENVILSGVEAPITAAEGSTAEQPKGQASVTVTPIVARVEIKSIGTKTEAVNNIVSYTLQGVFVPNHYANGAIVGAGTGALVLPALANYTANFSNGLFDFNEAGLTKDDAKVYAYHTFPAVGTANLPWIVIKVKDVKYNNGVTETLYDEGREQFITVKSYKKSGVAVENFEAAKIYSLSAVNFGLDNLSSDPNNSPKSVTVDVTVTAWSVEEITPDI